MKAFVSTIDIRPHLMNSSKQPNELPMLSERQSEPRTKAADPLQF